MWREPSTDYTKIYSTIYTPMLTIYCKVQCTELYTVESTYQFIHECTLLCEVLVDKKMRLMLLTTRPGDLVMPDPFGRFFGWFWTILDQFGYIWTILSSWTSLFLPVFMGPVYLDPSIWTCLFGPVYLDLSLLTQIFWPIYFDYIFKSFFWTCLFGPIL